ncbi:D-alanyl-D-alanine carboxypeptidase family protein [Oscillibacter sp.]|uniref:D-alanyl-D-alanine carboxypeptidase family protein n=1 Tax=Oscillibacter sp. TaxID=1945593 RepID=UPI002601C040|nr:serine hydrolase [Oscillibacter sp.]MDD3347926.1 serine hydrolase [Oscillibacter sp.]
MDDQYTPAFSDEERQELRAQRAELRRKKLRERRLRRLRQIVPATALALGTVLLLSAWGLRKKPVEAPAPEVPVQTMAMLPAEPEKSYAAKATPETVSLGDSVDSSYAVLIDQKSGAILAEKDADTVISPASMTKILTLLVAAEHLTDLDDTFTMTIDITDYCYVNSCSVVGLLVGETVPIRELLYGTILPSGADAALALATYVAGSQEAFVALMNEKLEELGLSDTAHFTNCVGLYDEAHVCTVYDMAMILNAAMDNPLCREVLGARTYATAPTPQHPDGQVLSNWFLRRIEDRFDETFQIVGAKTGYVVQAGSCAASSGQDVSGNLYLCVTGDASSSWRAIYDHTALYQTYCAAG